MIKNKFKLITKMPVSKYKCGLKAGDFVRLKKNIVVRGKKIGQQEKFIMPMKFGML